MFDQPQRNFIIFIVSTLVLLTIFGVFIVTLIYKYQKRQIAYFKELEELKVIHENTLLQSQLEVQEQTFQHIAREIHDNIGQKLTLAKLYLNTLAYSDADKVRSSVGDSLLLISDSINGLSDVSRSMGTEVVISNGLVKGIEMELNKLDKTGIYRCRFDLKGKEIFLNSNAEIILFRIVQECINNFIKHAGGSCVAISLSYNTQELVLEISDNGKGFDITATGNGAGLANIKKRAAMLMGSSTIESNSNGTTIIIRIPMNENTKQTQPDTGR